MCQERINEYFHEARVILEQDVKLSLEKKQLLWEYALSLLSRES